jgi:hypothetical protein
LNKRKLPTLMNRIIRSWKTMKILKNRSNHRCLKFKKISRSLTMRSFKSMLSKTRKIKFLIKQIKRKRLSPKCHSTIKNHLYQLSKLR